jgi:hypothetical protein
MQLRTMVNVVGALLPLDITGAAQTGQWISLKYYRRLTIILNQGAWAGGTPAVTLTQAQNVSGTGAKPLAFTKRYQQAWNTGATGYVETAVTGNTFNLPSSANQMHLIEVAAESLDINNGFDCVRVNVASPGAFADLLTGLYLLSGARYQDGRLNNALAN